MDISVEILATSVPIKKENLHYKLKTWWAHVDVKEHNSSVIPIPTLPMIQPFYDMNGRETTVFVEMWYSNPDLFPVGAMRFLGLAKQRVDNQLRNPAWNPTVEWLEVYDPIEDITRGRLLLKIDAHFQPSTAAVSSPLVSGTPRQAPHPVSSYFNNSFPESVVTTSSQIQDNASYASKDAIAKVLSPEITFHTNVSPIPKTKKVSEKEERLEFPRHLNNPLPALNSNSDSDGKLKLKANDKDRIDLDLEIAKAKLDLAVRERERNLKLLEEKGQPFTAQVRERGYNSLPDFWNLDMSPIGNIPATTATTPPRRRRYKHCRKSSPNRSPPPPKHHSATTTTDDSEVDDVINILNQNVRIPPHAKNEAAIKRNKLNSNPQPPLPKMADSRTDNLVKNVEQLERLQIEIKNARPKQRFESQGPIGHCDTSKFSKLNAMAKVLDEEDLTIYGCGFHVRQSSRNQSNNKKGPTTSLNYALVKERTSNTYPTSENIDNYTKPSNSSSTATPIPPISRKCAASFFAKK